MRAYVHVYVLTGAQLVPEPTAYMESLPGSPLARTLAATFTIAHTFCSQ